jgi:glycosyltransferase involved in cell wall biosynthesis
VIRDGVTGRLVPCGDLRSAAEALAEAASLGRADCRRHARESLDLELSIDAHERLYARLGGAADRRAAGATVGG